MNPTSPEARTLDPQPAWDIALLFPSQGEWSEEEYLSLNTNRLVEFSDGLVEVLAMPTMGHQKIVAYIHRRLFDFVMALNLGTVLLAPFRVRLWPGKIRQPDVVFLEKEHGGRMGEELWQGADLGVEVVSHDSRHRDHEVKRAEYARAGIREYWIVDPGEQVVTVLQLAAGAAAYTVAGEFRPGDTARSVLLPGFALEVDAVLAAAK
jgi:Uma2 family endonuclease